MIYLLYPRKKVSSNILTVYASCATSKIGIIEHAGYGVVVRVGDRLHVYLISGHFIQVLNCIGIGLELQFAECSIHRGFIKFLTNVIYDLRQKAQEVG